MSNERTELLRIKRLPLREQSEYKPFLIGNDVSLSTADISSYAINEEFVLIGTAMFGSVQLACKLSNNTLLVPTIIIIDNSCHTSSAWRSIKTFFAAAQPNQNFRKFLYAEDGFIALIEELLDKDLIRPDSNISQFFLKFFQQHSLDYVQKIVAKLEVIEQDWSNENTFTKLKAIYHDRPIVTYSSNIIPCVSIDNQVQILRNIERLDPYLSFCTNLDKTTKTPTMHYVFTDSAPLVICEAMGLEPEVAASLSAKSNTHSDIDKDSSENKMDC